MGTIAASMMTVVSIVFAILLMILTLASMQFSPRIIVGFARDRVTQQTLGIFLGTFSYCIAALPAARSVPHPFSPVLTIVGAMVLALACVAWLLYLIHHISQAISVNHIVEKIADEVESVIDEMMPEAHRRRYIPSASPSGPFDDEAPVLSDKSGYVRFIDTKRLAFLAKSYGVAVRIVRRVGQFVPAGIPVLMVSRGHRLSPERSVECRRAFDFGAKADVGVRRLLRALDDMAIAVSDSTMREALVERGRRVVAGCAAHLDEDEIQELRSRLATLECRTRIAEESSS